MTNSEFDFFISNSLEKKVDSYTSYAAMFQSKVVVGTTSTLLRENLAIGGKILSCNLLPTNIYDFPVQGICSIKNCTFEEFEKKLLQIYSISEKDYFLKLSKDKCYAVEYDEKVSTIEILKRKIDLFLVKPMWGKNNNTFPLPLFELIFIIYLLCFCTLDLVLSLSQSILSSTF